MHMDSNTEKQGGTVDVGRFHVALVMCPIWNISQPPLATACIAAQLKAAGYDVSCHDLSRRFVDSISTDHRREVEQTYLPQGWFEDFDRWRRTLDIDRMVETWAAEIARSEPAVAGFTIYDATLSVSLLLAREIKRLCPETVIIFGGPTCDNAAIMRKGPVDFLVCGEGEVTAVDLLGRIRNGQPVSDCPGIAWRAGTEIVRNPPRPRVEDINEIPFPDFDGFDLRAYPERKLPMLTSRGCPNRCSFCSESPRWGRYRHRSAENIVAEMERNLREYGIAHSSMEDSLINGNLDEFARMCDLILERGLKVTWGGKARIHPRMNLAFLAKARAAGCVALIFGIESASQKILDHMRKNVQVPEVEQVIRDCHDVVIHVSCFFIVGYVNEGEDEFQETLEFIRRNRPFIDVVYPGTGLYILEGSQLHRRANDLGIVLPQQSPDGRWRSADGTNTEAVRAERSRRLDALIAELYSTAAEGQRSAPSRATRWGGRDIYSGFAKWARRRFPGAGRESDCG